MTESIRIVSGGQTGVDRAALDFALANNYPCGGWCPKGRRADDGTIPDLYPLKELSSPEYAARTKQNILDSDATLVIYDSIPDRGTKYTIEQCLKLKRPVLYHALEKENDYPEVLAWLKFHHVHTLNVAGPKESNAPGIYKKSYQFLVELLNR